MHLPDGQVAQALDAGLSVLSRRGVIRLEGENVSLNPADAQILSYYAASVLQRLDAPGGIAPHGSMQLDLPERPKSRKS